MGTAVSSSGSPPDPKGAVGRNRPPKDSDAASPRTTATHDDDSIMRQRRRDIGLDDDEPTLPQRPPQADGGGGESTTANAATSSGKHDPPAYSQPRPPALWRKGPVIGKGAGGVVYEAIDDASGGIFCVKEFDFPEDFADRPADRARLESLRAEVALLQEVSHPNVVRFIGVEKRHLRIYVMMELVAGGSLQKIVRQFGTLSEELTRKYTRQIVDGLAYLHEHNIIHRDIKGANILVTVDGRVKIADFGAAKRLLDPTQLFQTLAGTPYWMAPEVVRQQGHGKPADVWSLGCTVIQMLTGYAPYQTLAPVPALFKIGHETGSAIPSNLKASDLAKDFLARCLHRDASARATVQELQGHPWLAVVTTPTPSPARTAALSSAAAPALPAVKLGDALSEADRQSPALEGAATGGVPLERTSVDPPAASSAPGRHVAAGGVDVDGGFFSTDEPDVMEYIATISLNHRAGGEGWGGATGEEEGSGSDEDGDGGTEEVAGESDVAARPPGGAAPSDESLSVQYDEGHFRALVHTMSGAKKQS